MNVRTIGKHVVAVLSCYTLYGSPGASAHPEDQCPSPDQVTEEACAAWAAEASGAQPPEPEEDLSVAALDSAIVFRSHTGYIDSALVISQLRLRYDWNFDANAPDRVEFIYGECDCNAEGVSPGPTDDLDYQEVTVSYEQALSDRLSLFADIPYRDVSVDIPAGFGRDPGTLDASGLGDVIAGLKYAFIAQRDRYLTLQVKGYFPTGEAEENLGTDHGSIEPGLLYFQRLSPHWGLESEFRWWHPLDEATDYADDVLRLGIGISRQGSGRTVSVTPVAELVGWYVTGGKKTETDSPFVKDADSDTIVNLKLGTRLQFGSHPGSVYVGLGFALTNQVWYDDVLRVEYRLQFADL